MPVDLDDVDGQLVEIGQGGIAGAKIIQGEAHPEVPAGAHDLGGGDGIVQGGDLEDLDLQAHRLALPPVVGEGAGDEFVETRLLDLPWADIDAQRQVHALLPPGLLLGQGGGDHPLAQGDIQRGILDLRQEAVRSQEALAGVLPAYQRLQTDDLAVSEIDLRLVMKQQLTGFQGLGELLAPMPALPLLVVLDRVIEVIAPLIAALGLEQRLVGVLEQGIRPGMVGGEDGQSQAGGEVQAMALDLHRQIDLAKEPLCRLQGIEG